METSRPDADRQARRGQTGLTETSRPDGDRSAVSANGPVGEEAPRACHTSSGWRRQGVLSPAAGIRKR